MALEAIQLKPAGSEAVAEWFEKLAAEARAGDIIGCSAIIIKPGSKWAAVGIGEGTNIAVIGYHYLAIAAIADTLTR